MNERTLYQILQATKFSKTLSEIADKLYFSQPYISKVLKKAETKYGTNLIARNTNPISLTNAGLLVLEHLQIILDTEDDLDRALKSANEMKTIKILVTNPFLSDMLFDKMASYITSHPKISFEISSYPLTNGLKALQNRNFDLIVGRRYVDSEIQTIKLPQNDVFSLIGKNCKIFDPNKLLLPFKKEYVTDMQNSSLISFENSEGIEDYILRRFHELGFNIKKAAKVDTVAQACQMAQSINRNNLIALTDNYTAHKLLGSGNYNLLNLPDNALHFDNAIMSAKTANEKIIELSNYLESELTKEINLNNFSNLQA